MLCNNCYKKLEPRFISFDVSNISALAIYDYDENLESLIYQFKGCYDIELAPIFLERFRLELYIKYKGYYIIPIPSYHIDDEKRGFNHVIEIFKIIGLDFINILYKTKPFKQASNSRNNRNKIEDCLTLLSNKSLKDKKILLVDDVYTTGSTMRAALKLIKKLNPKDIKILVLSKTTLKPLANNK